MCNFVAIKNTKIKSLCKPLEIEFKKNFFLCKLLRAVTISWFSCLFFNRSVRKNDNKTCY